MPVRQRVRLWGGGGGAALLAAVQTEEAPSRNNSAPQPRWREYVAYLKAYQRQLTQLATLGLRQLHCTTSYKLNNNIH